MAKRGYKLQEFVAHASDVNCVHIGKKSRRVFVTGGGDCKVNLWAIGKPTSLLSLSGHTSSVQSVILDSAEVLVLAGSSNGPIKLWDLEEAKIVRTLSGHRSNCTAVEFHPFGEFFASGSLDTDLKIWDIRKKGCIHTYKGHTRGIRSIKFTPDGRWVVTGGEDNIVKLWDLTAGKLLHDFKFHNGSVRCIDFHPHEFLLATGSADQTVKFWDLETFELIGSAGPEATGVRSMVFHQDGKVLFCGLDEILKVFSWEPIRCHDIVEMGWSILGDLSIYEEKLLGCSYYRNRVGVWVADISLIGPFAAGIVPMTNALMEPLYSRGDYHSLEIARDSTISSKTLVAGPLDCVSETKEAQKSSCMASLQEVNQAWNTTPTIPTEFRKSNTTLSRQSASPKFGSRISRNLSLNSLTFKSDKATESRLPTTNRRESSFAARDGSLRSTTVSADSLLSCKKGPMVKENALNNSQSLSRSFSVPNIVPGDHPRLEANEENVSSREQTRSSSRNVAERFDRIMLVEQPDGLDNCRLEESPCSSTETNSVKYVKGVAVQLGKTRSLVESWERRERCDSNYRNTSSSSSDQVDRSVSFSSMQKGQVLSSEMGVPAADDFVFPGSLLQNHDVFINVVKSRLTKLQVVRHFWEQKGIYGAINAVGKLPDQSVQIDVFSILREKIDLFTLDLFSSSLPMLVGLLNSKTERHVTISVEILLELVKIFAPVIVSTKSASSSLGVDLQREKRLERCNQCFNHLRKIKLVLPSLLRRGGLQTEHARELALILHDMSPN